MHKNLFKLLWERKLREALSEFQMEISGFPETTSQHIILPVAQAMALVGGRKFCPGAEP